MSHKPQQNHAGGLTNVPQHMGEASGARNQPPLPDASVATGKASGPGTAPPNLAVAAPHPAEEGHPYGAKHPGGAHPPTDDLGPNPAITTGQPVPRPHNASSGPEPLRPERGSATGTGRV